MSTARSKRAAGHAHASFFNSLLTSLQRLTVCSTEATQITKAEIVEATLNEGMLD